MAEESGDKAPLEFDSPDLNWADDPEPTEPADSPSATEETPPEEDAASTPEPAIPASADETEGSQDRQPQGPIPFDRHKAILDKAYAERDELKAKWQRVQWAETLADSGKTPEQVQHALQIYDGIDQNPSGFLQRFYDRLKDDPTLGPQVRSWAGKVLGTARSAAPGGSPPEGAQGDVEPQPDFQDANGTPFYSAPQLRKWQAWNARQQESRFQQALAPLQQAEQTRQQQQAQQRLEADVTRVMAQKLETLRQNPVFKAHEGKVKAYLQAHNWNVSLEEAFNHVLVTDILPHANQTAKAEQLAELKTKAAAGSVNPRSAPVTSPERPTDFDDPRLKW